MTDKHHPHDLAWKGDFQIPRTIRLPGLPVYVRLVKKSHPGLGGDAAAWFYDVDKEVGIILIDKSLPLSVQRYSLWHELQHVCIDALDILLEGFLGDVSPMSVLRETDLKER